MLGNCLRSLLILLFFLSPTLLSLQTAHAFYEDLCFKDGFWYNCIHAEGCGHDDLHNASCRSKALGSLAGNQTTVRSMMHTDAIHFLAQAVGMTPEAAYWLAAYSEATDLGQYIPTNSRGAALTSSTSFHTANIAGWTRMSGVTGGYTVHFPFVMAAGKAGEPVNGLYPKLNDPHREGVLYHLRQWGLFGSLPACIGGLTEFDPKSGTYFTGTRCYKDELQAALKTGKPTQSIPRYIRAKMPILSVGPRANASIGQVPAPILNAYSGSSIVQFTETTSRSAPTAPYITAATFDENFSSILSSSTGRMNGKPVPVSIARFGIYLHALMDRISHQKCLDNSPVKSPIGSDTWVLEYESPYCSIDQHTYGHYQEVGQPNLPERTYSALRYAYQEMQQFAYLYPQFLRKNFTVIPENVLIGASAARPGILDKVLTTADACQRLKKMIAAVDTMKFSQMPGNSLANIACRNP